MRTSGYRTSGYRTSQYGRGEGRLVSETVG
jgi:hypothetical protein